MPASGNDARVPYEDIDLQAALMALTPGPRGSVHGVGQAPASDAGATRLDTAHGLLARWPDTAAHALSRSLGLARTYRLITIAPGELAACLARGTWRGSFLALRGWRSGDGLMFHVKQVSRLRAIAIVTDEPRLVGQAWQAGFRVAAQLEDGVDPRAALAPLRRGRPARWFRGFVGTHHVIQTEDAAALLDAFEDALLASV